MTAAHKEKNKWKYGHGFYSSSSPSSADSSLVSSVRDGSLNASSPRTHPSTKTWFARCSFQWVASRVKPKLGRSWTTWKTVSEHPLLTAKKDTFSGVFFYVCEDGDDQYLLLWCDFVFKRRGGQFYCLFVNQKIRFNRIIFITTLIVWKLFTLAFLTK